MILDKAAVRRAFDVAATSYSRHAILQKTVAKRLLQHLEWLNIKPSTVLDMGAGTGEPTADLMQRFPKANIVALDFSIPMLKQAEKQRYWLKRPKVVCGDCQLLPICSQCVDLVFSNLSLQWCERPDYVFSEVRRVLKPGGVLLFSSFGSDTLKELRQAWACVDTVPRVHEFLDMHDLGDKIVHARLQEPVMEREEIVLTYTDVRSIRADLKYIGASNALSGRSRGLLGRNKYQDFIAAYERYRSSEGRLPATYEIVYGTAWGPTDSPKAVSVELNQNMVKSRPG